MAHVSNMYLRRKGDDDSSLVLSHSDHWSEDLILRDFLFDEAGELGQFDFCAARPSFSLRVLNESAHILYDP